MLYLSIAAVVVILAIAYKNELMSFLGKLKSRKKEVSTPPLKEVVLTVSDKGEGYNGCKYLKFSDGHTLRADTGTKDYVKWLFCRKGDKVRKLIYANKDPEYTPVFEDDINKDNADK